MGRFQFPRALRPGQPSDSHRWHPDCRRCLLKGCERWFRPRRPQARYCRPACQDAARRWRRWRAGQRYRDTANGQQHRRDQSRRHRDRQRQRSARSQPDPPTPHVESPPTAVEADPPPPPIHRVSHPTPPWASAQPNSSKNRPACLATGPAVMSSSSPHHDPPIRSSVRARVDRRYDASDSAKPGSGSGAAAADGPDADRRGEGPHPTRLCRHVLRIPPSRLYRFLTPQNRGGSGWAGPSGPPFPRSEFSGCSEGVPWHCHSRAISEASPWPNWA